EFQKIFAEYINTRTSPLAGEVRVFRAAAFSGLGYGIPPGRRPGRSQRSGPAGRPDTPDQSGRPPPAWSPDPAPEGGPSRSRRPAGTARRGGGRGAAGPPLVSPKGCGPTQTGR